MATNENREESKKTSTTIIVKKTMPQIKIEQTDIDAIVPRDLEKKPIPKMVNLFYYELPFYYNYGTKAQPNHSEFLVEGPKFKSTRGLVMKEFNGKPSWSIMQYLGDKDPAVKLFREMLFKIYLMCGYHLSKYKGTIGIPKFDYKNPAATGLKEVISYKTDDQGEPIPGKEPYIYFKVVKTYDHQTLFTEIDIKKEIKWELLQNVEMEYIPLFHIEKIYIGGGKASLQMKMKSAIVTSIQGRNTSSNQIETAAKIKEEHPEAEMSLKDQLAHLTLQRQDELEKSMSGSGLRKAENNKSEISSNGPKITAIDPTNVDIANFFKSTQNESDS